MADSLHNALTNHVSDGSLHNLHLPGYSVANITAMNAISTGSAGDLCFVQSSGSYYANSTNGVWQAMGGASGGGSTGARYPVQNKASTYGSASQQAITLSGTPTNGNKLIAIVTAENGTNVTSITQTNVSWSKLAESTASTAPHAEIWIGAVSASASTSCTVDFSGAGYCGFHLSEWSGLTGALDQSSSVTNVTGSQAVPTITPTSQTALVVASGAQSTYSSGFELAISYQLITFDQSAGTGGRYAAAFGFPGTSPVLCYFPNTHGGTFSAAIVSIT